MLCTLCSQALSQNPLREGEKVFCCRGCQIVYDIIGSQPNYHESPLFQEALKVGMISNPHIDEKEKELVHRAEINVHVEIGGMWCPACSEALQLILRKQKGVIRCTVDYATDLAVIVINPFHLSKEKVINLIEKLGYRASELFSKEKNHISRVLLLRFAIASFCTMNIMMLSYPLYALHFGLAIDGYSAAFGWLNFLLSLPLVSYCAWPIWKRLSLSVKSGLFGMETLIFIGVWASFLLSTYYLIMKEASWLYFDTLSMVITFVLLGNILEKKAKFSAKETILSLTRTLPNKGCKLNENRELMYVPIKDILCGDLLLSRTGEKIVLDGLVVEGKGVVDESIMTGESKPIQKKEGDQIIGGSLLKQGSLIYKVLKDAQRSLLGQIASIIEKDLGKKNHTEELVGKITFYFIPSVLLLATLALIFSGPFHAMSILLIACPCALGIATPLAQSRILFRFAKLGALVRSRHRVWFLADDPLFVFDKTGTLTEGKFKIIEGLSALDEDLCMILKALTSHSSHPVSIAIHAELSCHTACLDEVREVVGRGMEGKSKGNFYMLGSERFLKERGIDVPQQSGEENTVVYFVQNEKILTKISLGDSLRSPLPKVKGGILSGDAQLLVKSVAEQCGFLWGKGGVDPIQKREEILKLKAQGQKVVMVGDGVNDAPAMGAADLGISVVSGADMAIEVCDILLTTECLDSLPKLCLLAKKGRKIIAQNLFWAFFYNIIGIGLASIGLLNPLFAAAAMAISSLIVTLNSLRI